MYETSKYREEGDSQTKELGGEPCKEESGNQIKGKALIPSLRKKGKRTIPLINKVGPSPYINSGMGVRQTGMG
jgi:hypothetical protein